VDIALESTAQSIRRCRRTVGRVLYRVSRARHGVATVEMAILLPCFLLFLIGVCEFGRALWTQSALQYAVEAAARCRALNASGCTDTGSTQTYAAGEVFGLSVAASEFSVSTPSCGTQVSVSHAFDPIVTKLVPGLSITLTAQSCHP
jgi:uncharacterized membrane protein